MAQFIANGWTGWRKAPKAGTVYYVAVVKGYATAYHYAPTLAHARHLAYELGTDNPDACSITVLKPIEYYRPKKGRTR